MQLGDIRIGLFFPSYVWGDTHEMEPLADFDACLDLAEEHELDVWVIDHLLVAPGLYGSTWLDPLVTLSYAAAKTKTVKLGTAILVVPLRQPVLLAKEIASLQALSGGRFELGIGPGWHANEFASVGGHISQRGRRTDETYDALELLLTKENVSYQGRHYSFEDVTIVPRPGMPPVWVGGGSRIPDPGESDLPDIAETVKDRVLRAGRWISRASGKQEWVKRDWTRIVEHAERKNVDPASITFGHANLFHFVPEAKTRDEALEKQRPTFERVMGTHRPFEQLQECYLMGTTEEIIERLRDLIDAGCTFFCLGPTTADPEQVRYFATEVIPKLR